MNRWDFDLDNLPWWATGGYKFDFTDAQRLHLRDLCGIASDLWYRDDGQGRTPTSYQDLADQMNLYYYRDALDNDDNEVLKWYHVYNDINVYAPRPYFYGENRNFYSYYQPTEKVNFVGPRCW